MSRPFPWLTAGACVVFLGVGIVVGDGDEGVSPECAAKFAAYWRAEPDAGYTTHNDGIRRVNVACDGWPWPILDALFYNEDGS